jgi:ABC-type transport system substrate-binding protein
MSYWNGYLGKRLARRRVLAGAAAGTASALLVSACGGDDGSGGDEQGGLVSFVNDTTASAVKGGTWQSYVSSDSPGFDPLTQAASTVPAISNYSLSRLLKYKLGTREDRPSGEIDGDAAVGWEVAGDGLQVTFKLRPGMRFDHRPPTSGKDLTAADVLFSWEQYSTLAGTRGVLANRANATAPILSMTAPDSQTIVTKLAFPCAPLLPMLGYHWYLVIQAHRGRRQVQPKERYARQRAMAPREICPER